MSEDLANGAQLHCERAIEDALARCDVVRVRQRRPLTQANTPVGMLFETDEGWDGTRPGEVAQGCAVLLSPSDVTKRRRWSDWRNQLRPYYRLDPEDFGFDRVSPEYAAGAKVVGEIVAVKTAVPPQDSTPMGRLALPAKCCKCLAPPASAVIVEGLVPDKSERGVQREPRRVWGFEPAEGDSAWGGKKVQVEEVARAQRIWIAVPSCAEHIAATAPVTLNTSSLRGRWWISFRNERYGSEFAEMNGLRTHHPMFHGGNLVLWLTLVLLPLLVGVLALLGGVLGTAAVAFAISSIGIIWTFGRMPLHRKRTARDLPIA